MAEAQVVQTGAFTSETAAIINSNLAAKTTLVLAGSTLTLTAANSSNTILLDTVTGSTVTLPAATGSGIRIKFIVKTIATSNSHIVKTAGSDIYQGIIATVDSATVTAYVAASNSNTITLNRTTTGSVSVGEHFTVVDSVSGVWTLEDGMTSSSGTAATPFSHV